MISKMIVENFDGHINFASDYKKGSVFYFTFETETINEWDLEGPNLMSALNENKAKIPQFKSSKIPDMRDMVSTNG